MVVDDAEDLRPSDAVDGGMMHAEKKRATARADARDLIQPLDEVDLPRWRVRSIGRACNRATCLHNCARARCRQRQMANMELEIESRVIDPVRVAEIERHGHQSAAKGRCQVNTARQMVDELLVGQRTIQPVVSSSSSAPIVLGAWAASV